MPRLQSSLLRADAILCVSLHTLCTHGWLAEQVKLLREALSTEGDSLAQNVQQVCDMLELREDGHCSPEDQVWAGRGPVVCSWHTHLPVIIQHPVQGLQGPAPCHRGSLASILKDFRPEDLSAWPLCGDCSKTCLAGSLAHSVADRHCTCHDQHAHWAD